MRSGAPLGGPDRGAERRATLLIALSLALAVFAIYWPVRDFPFVSFDDPLYVSNNAMVQQGLTPAGVEWAFRTFHAVNWHPLTWLSHMLDVSLFGPDASGMHHLVNVILHAANAILLFVLLRSMTGTLWRSAAVALLFAVHPLRVESVAWVAERKDVLSTALGLLALLVWVRWTRRGGSLLYLLAIASAGLGLMAKPMLVTLPGILLLLDVWPLRRLDLAASPREIARRTARLMLEKAPFVALSLAGSVATLLAQRSGSALAPLDAVPLLARLAIAVSGVAEYLRLVLWPRGLAVLYPLYLPPVRQWLASLVLVAVVTILVVAARRSRPWLLVGWLWFLGTLIPVSGLVSVGSQFVADRYTYVPAIGLLIALVWLAAEMLERAFGRRIGGRVGAALALVTAIPLAIVARAQVQVWSDSVVLYRHAIAVTRPNGPMQNLLAAELTHRGDLAGARVHLREAHRLHPDQVDVLNNLAALLVTDPDPARRDGAEAVRLAERAVALSPKPEATVLDTLAAAYAEAGRFDAAARTAQRALEAANEAGREDLARRIAAKIPAYRAGRPSRELHFEGVARPKP